MVSYLFLFIVLLQWDTSDSVRAILCNTLSVQFIVSLSLSFVFLWIFGIKMQKKADIKWLYSSAQNVSGNVVVVFFIFASRLIVWMLYICMWTSVYGARSSFAAKSTFFFKINDYIIEFMFTIWCVQRQGSLCRWATKQTKKNGKIKQSGWKNDNK